jgi:hypothetical protein
MAIDTRGRPTMTTSWLASLALFGLGYWLAIAWHHAKHLAKSRQRGTRPLGRGGHAMSTRLHLADGHSHDLSLLRAGPGSTASPDTSY